MTPYLTPWNVETPSTPKHTRHSTIYSLVKPLKVIKIAMNIDFI
jgi:streptomycin 6-kinase